MTADSTWEELELEKTTWASQKHHSKGAIYKGVEMPWAPYDNYLDGLKEQVNIELCSTDRFIEDREVF